MSERNRVKNQNRASSELKASNRSKIISLIAIIVTVFFGCLFAWKLYSVIFSAKSGMEAYFVYDSTNRDVFLQNGLYDSTDVVTGNIEGRIIAESEDIEAGAELSAWGGSTALKYSLCNLTEKDVLITEFTARTDNPSPIPIGVTCGRTKTTVWIGKERRKYYIPAAAKKDNNELLIQYEISEETVSPVLIGDFSIVDYGQEFPTAQLKVGNYALDSYEIENVDVDNPDNVVSRATDIASVGEYLYVLLNGELIVRIGNEEVGRLKGLGDALSVEVSNDGQRLVVVSKECGAFFVDISNPMSPKVLSHYDTLEWCYNAIIAGNCAFLCDSLFGVEIVDLTDYENPKYVGRIKNPQDSDYKDLCYADGYLYVSANGSKRVDIYNVNDMSDVRRISSVETDGYAKGMNASNGHLYIATSHYPLKNATSSVLWYGCGTGSGLDVFDISDVTRPKLVSRSKVDGRYNNWPGDNADVEIYGNYALVSLMSAGTFVYDISEPSKPVLVKNINAVVGKESKLFRELPTETIVMTYDFSEETHGGMIHSLVYQGEIYCLASDMGIVKATLATGMNSGGVRLPKVQGNLPRGIDSDKAVKNELGCVNAVAELSDGNLVAACGAEGIKILDKDCRVLYSYNPRDYLVSSRLGEILNTGIYAKDMSGFFTVKDVKVYGNYIHTAEGCAGFAIYQYADGSVTEVGRLADKAWNSYCSSVTALDDGSLAIVQAGGNGGRYLLIDCKDPSNLKALSNPATEGISGSCHRNVSIGQVGDYIAISGNKRIGWFRWLKEGEQNDLPEDGSKGKQEDYQVRYLKDESKLATGEWTGLTSLGPNRDECIITTAKGYKIYNPKTGAVSEEIPVEESYAKGKCVASDNYLVITRTWEGKVIVLDISNPSSPTVVTKVDTGSVTDIPCIVGDKVYVPCRHDGIRQIKLK